jgi:Cd2+/Zn2+-exporting ATPase
MSKGNKKPKKDIKSAIFGEGLLLKISIVLSAALFFVGLFAKLPDWLINAFFAAAVVVTAYDIIIDAVVVYLKKHALEKRLLMIAAVIAAFAIGREAEGAAAMIIFRIGGVVQEYVIEQLVNAIERFIDLRPSSVNASVKGTIVKMAAGSIQAGDVIIVAPNEMISLDGTVIYGKSVLDVSAITGEKTPKTVQEGSEVLSGSINLTGEIKIRVSAEFDESTVSRKLKLVERSEHRKSPQEILTVRFARIFTPAVIGAALILSVLVPLIGHLPFTDWINKALGYLVVAYPTALTLSVSLTYFAGIGSSSKRGILFKGADVVDTISKTTSVVFDKTGTLTAGDFHITDVRAYGISKAELLMLAAYAEAYSNHPIARAIVNDSGVVPDLFKITNHRELPGKGVEVKIGEMTVTAGNASFMADIGVMPDASAGSDSVVYVAVNNKFAGQILLSDTINEDARKAVQDLNAIDIDRIAVFTGDNKEAAELIASQLGIREVYAECMPEEKANRLKGLHEMQLDGDKLVYVGDGVNDAPLLKLADVGVTIGGFKSLESSEAADIIIMTDEPSKIAAAILTARHTKKIVKENIAVSLGLKALILLLIGLLHMPIWLAVLIDSAVTIFAVVNSKRAFEKDEDNGDSANDAEDKA